MHYQQLPYAVESIWSFNYLDKLYVVIQYYAMGTMLFVLGSDNSLTQVDDPFNLDMQSHTLDIQFTHNNSYTTHIAQLVITNDG